MKNVKTITIGIPAFNEEENIKNILDDITKQELTGYHLEKIIVSSDGSTDKTDEIVRYYSHPKVQLISNSLREGLAARQNQLFEMAQSDVLVVIQADTRINDSQFLQKITEPILNGKADLVSVRINEVRGKTLTERVLNFGMRIKRHIAENLRSGKNVYTCCGLARAFSRNLYSQMRFESSIGEDAFSFFYVLKNNFKYYHLTNTSIFYRVASEYIQHSRQSVRFFESRRIMMKKFGKAYVKKQYVVPLKNTADGIIWGLGENPIYTFLYLLSVAFVKTLALVNRHTTRETWQVATSSKKVQI